MTLKIQTTVCSKSRVFVLTGRMQSGQLAELQSLLDSETSSGEIVLDLKELRLVDQESIRFLARCEAEGAKLRNCPAYIAKWISQEQVGLHRNGD
jgi:hypothetical protein